MKKHLQTDWFAPALFAPGILVLLPLVGAFVMLVRYSFNDWDPMLGMVPAWTLENYYYVFTDPAQFKGLVTTLRISLVVTVVCLFVGYPVAVAISQAGRYRGLLMFLLVTPMLTDVLIRAYGWMVILGPNGPVNSLLMASGLSSGPARLMYTELAVVLELIHENIPFMILPLAAVLERINPALNDAAMNLGASPARTFFHVTLPLSRPGIIAGTLLVFALSSSAFVAPLVLGGGNVSVMTTLMQQTMLTTLNWPQGSAQSVVLVGLVLVLLAGYGWVLSRGRRTT
ncbi:ABC transporter permease [Mesorhizobium sp. 1M-11]|uniref:ABC transporter permease n=1 Tax=Mesorhizobium sp. 1M-11 TaxID=1529006 RepID=UPI00128F59CD|nr:ABC transporter permease [Mesorhizobium sp. 1M-11]